MNELTKEQIDRCWDSQISGYGRSRYDIARAIIQADRAQRQAGQEPVAWALGNAQCGLGSWLFESRKQAVSFDKTAKAGKPARSLLVPLYTALQPVQPALQSAAQAILDRWNSPRLFKLGN